MSQSFIVISALCFTAAALIAGCSSPPAPCTEHVANSSTSTAPYLLLLETREGYGQQVRPIDPVSLEALPGYEPIDFSRRYDHVVSPDGQTLAAMLHPDDSPGSPGWQLRVIDLTSWTAKIIDLDVQQRTRRLLKKGVQVGNRRSRSLKPWFYWRKSCRSHGTFSPFGFADRPSWGTGHR